MCVVGASVWETHPVLSPSPTLGPVLYFVVADWRPTIHHQGSNKHLSHCPQTRYPSLSRPCISTRGQPRRGGAVCRQCYPDVRKMESTLGQVGSSSSRLEVCLASLAGLG